MIYYKPKNLTYSQLCQWIDDNSNRKDCDDYTLYKYLYLIIDILAKKNHYFSSKEDYEDFALFTANNVFMRIIRFRGNAEKNIQYILPYLKKVIRFSLSDFIKEEKPVREPVTEDFVYYNFYDLLSNLSGKLLPTDFKACIDDVDRIIDDFFSKIPKKKRSDEWINIKTSVVLTLWKRLNVGSSNRVVKDRVGRAISDSRYNISPVLIGLDRKNEGYINILCNELIAFIGKELTEMVDYYSGISQEEFMDIFSGQESYYDG